MIICINCNTDIKKKMDSLLKEKDYIDYSELMSVAIENLWLMEMAVESKGSIVVNENLFSSSANQIMFSSKAGKQKVSTLTSQELPPMARIPDMFLLEGLDKINPSTSKPVPLKRTEDIITMDRWIFGQYNKLLPAKANCRALLHLMNNYKKGILLESACEKIGDAAIQLGDYLYKQDRRYQTGRDDSLATAFPRSGTDQSKSSSRYTNQFIGSINGQRVLSGLLSNYYFVTLSTQEENILLLTEPAVQFARLSNPILDNHQENPLQKFSDEEVTFLLKHIQSYVYVEAFTFYTLLHNIINGANTPDKLNEALHYLAPSDSNRSFSASFLISQRSGALSRMTDLNLITRIREGIRVTYAITEKGEVFMKDVSINIEKEKR